MNNGKCKEEITNVKSNMNGLCSRLLLSMAMSATILCCIGIHKFYTVAIRLGIMPCILSMLSIYLTSIFIVDFVWDIVSLIRLLVNHKK